MLTEFKTWKNITNTSNKELFTLFSFTILELSCYLFTPISFANIITQVTISNFQLASLWASINFLTQILNIITINLKSNFLKLTKFRITTNLNLSDQNSLIANFILVLADFATNALKLISIIIIASIYSLSLMMFIIVALSTCIIINTIIENSSKNTQLKQKNNLIQQNPFVVDTIWSIFMLIIILTTINLINNQKITLTIFLLFTSFINTHLIKPNFNLNLHPYIKSLKKELVSYEKICQKITNKNTNSPHTKKK